MRNVPARLLSEKMTSDAALTAHQRQEALQRLNAGETLADIAKTYAVDPTTIGRLRPFGEVSAAL
jgi:hypothetical protein